MSTVLYGVGAGPGDPELITVRGLRLLQSAGSVFLAATRPGASYVGAIVAQYLQPGQEVVELVCPPYRQRAAVEARWRELADAVARRLADGTHGVFVSEGDPSLYSTFQYLAAGLRRHPTISVETVPGVSAMNAAAALAGQPLALWDERLAVLPVTHEGADIASLLARFESVALLKAGGTLAKIATAVERLEDHAQVALVRRAGRPEQAVLRDLDAIRSAEADYFSTVLVRRKGDSA